MSTLTIYNCGTAFDINNTNSVISSLANRTVGQRDIDWIINAGPGSSEAVANGDTSLGTVDQITGLGMYTSLFRSIEHILNNKLPTVINLVGWSRGAITSLMIARFLQPFRISCNLFLLDPVVGDPILNGYIHQTAPINSIGSHVNSLFVIQQLDATDFIFQAHDPFDSPGNQAQRTTVLQLPGPHGAAAYRGDDSKYHYAYLIALNLAQDFLQRNGTALRGCGNVCSSESYLEYYSKLWLDVSSGFAYVPESESGGFFSNRRETTHSGNSMVMRVTFNSQHISVLNEYAPRTALALMYSLTARRRPAPNLLSDADREIERYSRSHPNQPHTREYLGKIRGWLRIYT